MRCRMALESLKMIRPNAISYYPVLTTRQIKRVPNLGKYTVHDVELWLWERGLDRAGSMTVAH